MKPGHKRKPDRYIDMLPWIGQFTIMHGYPPTVREITEGLHISSLSVTNYRLKRLQEEGHIDWSPGKARTIVIRDTL